MGLDFPVALGDYVNPRPLGNLLLHPRSGAAATSRPGQMASVPVFALTRCLSTSFGFRAQDSPASERILSPEWLPPVATGSYHREPSPHRRTPTNSLLGDARMDRRHKPRRSTSPKALRAMAIIESPDVIGSVKLKERTFDQGISLFRRSWHSPTDASRTQPMRRALLVGSIDIVVISLFGHYLPEDPQAVRSADPRPLALPDRLYLLDEAHSRSAHPRFADGFLDGSPRRLFRSLQRRRC